MLFSSAGMSLVLPNKPVADSFLEGFAGNLSFSVCLALYVFLSTKQPRTLRYQRRVRGCLVERNTYNAKHTEKLKFPAKPSKKLSATGLFGNTKLIPALLNNIKVPRNS
eukprot:TRINITY_DN3941_c0_g4_i1.p1 TRINITY_DN3941_c0_g4~~TRINITY_DN3941_c0_g4_i1.p1  ORF type:complete len:109 (-),score=15.10 TRINITY_DN3941_c0_g4_i1:158-484(-)